MDLLLKTAMTIQFGTNPSVRCTDLTYKHREWACTVLIQVRTKLNWSLSARDLLGLSFLFLSRLRWLREDSSNMAVIDVKLVSGYQADEDSLIKVRFDYAIRWLRLLLEERIIEPTRAQHTFNVLRFRNV